jgi:hypothetical protein
MTAAQVTEKFKSGRRDIREKRPALESCRLSIRLTVRAELFLSVPAKAGLNNLLQGIQAEVPNN